MSVKELLNPAIENKNMFNATDKDIFKSVMHAKALRDGGGSANSDDDDDNAGEPSPIHTEALDAMLTLRRYVSTFDDPFVGICVGTAYPHGSWVWVSVGMGQGMAMMYPYPHPVM